LNKLLLLRNFVFDLMSYRFYISIVACFSLFFCLKADAQMISGSELDNPDIQLRNESYFGVNINSHGWGISYRRGKHKTGTLKRMLDFDFVGYRHPKEVKISNRSGSNNSRSYYYGKLNNASFLRAGYGFQKVIFDEELPGALQIRLNYYTGASLGILKPVYLEIYKPSQIFPDRYELVTEKYNPEKHFVENIYGKAPYLKGINELSINPGVYGKFGVSFEYGPDQEVVRAIEAGVVVDFHPKAMQVMAFNSNNPLTFSFYVTVNWGKRWL
jgi:hypothetical protein